MINGRVFIDSFTGPAANLPKGERTPDNVMEALRRNGRVSTWDMSENRWLRDCIRQLLKDARIVEIVGNVAHNVLTNFMNNVAQTKIDFPVVDVAVAA